MTPQDWLKHEDHFDSDKHKVLRGNHDPQKFAERRDFDLGNHGLFNDVFYIRGAQSLGRHDSYEGKTWYKEEELTDSEADLALSDYVKAKPKIMITHDCPWSVAQSLFGTNIQSQTNRILQQALEIHQPEQWYFCHHHQSVSETIEGTRFRCLDELETTTV